MWNDINSSASALHEGGWTSEDKEQLMQEYQLTEEDAEEICEELKKFEH